MIHCSRRDHLDTAPAGPGLEMDMTAKRMTEGEKMAKRNQYLDKAAEFIRLGQCYEAGTSDRARFVSEARRMERLAGAVMK